MQAHSRKINLILTIIFAFVFNYSKADKRHLGFGFDSEKETVTIPFKSIKNLIIIESVIDGKNKLNLILDTGIRSLVLFDKSYIPKISDKTFDIKFSGTGLDGPISAEVSVDHDLRICDDIIAYQINAVILKKSNNYLKELSGIKIHGVFGYQLFSRFRVRIDYKNKLLTLSEPNKMNRIGGFEAVPLTIHDTKPFIKAEIFTENNKLQRLNLILDLGANHRLLILQKDGFTNSSKKASNYQRIAEGLSGSIFGVKTYAKKIKLGSIEYTNTEVLIPSKKTYINESPGIEKHGSLGARIFNDSIIIVDYINGYLFIEYQNKKSKTSDSDLVAMSPNQ